MQTIVSRSALIEVLGVASGVISARTVKDILKCVRLTTVDGGLLVSATDLEVGLRVAIRQVEVKTAGEVLVPVDKLVQIARESTEDTLELEGDADKCHIRGRDSHFEIYTQDPKEFPPVPDIEGDVDIEIEASALLGLIERTIFAVAKENTRYAINGILWEKQNKVLNLVATDGRRLAWARMTTDQQKGEDKQRIVPFKTMSVLRRVLGNVEGQVAVRFTDNQVLVHGGDYTVSSALVEGHFPQYQEVIPQDLDRKIELNTEELLSGVRKAALLTNEQSKGIRLQFTDGKLVLSSRAPEQGEATVSISADYKGELLEIGFNPVFIADVLHVVGQPTVVLELKSVDRPGIIRAGQEFLCVVMPVSLA